MPNVKRLYSAFFDLDDICGLRQRALKCKSANIRCLIRTHIYRLKEAQPDVYFPHHSRKLNTFTVASSLNRFDEHRF